MASRNSDTRRHARARFTEEPNHEIYNATTACPLHGCDRDRLCRWAASGQEIIGGTIAAPIVAAPFESDGFESAPFESAPHRVRTNARSIPIDCSYVGDLPIDATVDRAVTCRRQWGSAVGHDSTHDAMASRICSTTITRRAMPIRPTRRCTCRRLPVPPNVGHTFYTYQPFYPEEMLYWHKNRFHRYYDNGRGMNRTRAVYYSPPIRQAASNLYWNYLRIPR